MAKAKKKSHETRRRQTRMKLRISRQEMERFSGPAYSLRRHHQAGVELMMECEDDGLSPWQIEASRKAFEEYEKAMRTIKAAKARQVLPKVTSSVSTTKTPDVIIVGESPPGRALSHVQVSQPAKSQQKVASQLSKLSQPQVVLSNTVVPQQVYKFVNCSGAPVTSGQLLVRPLVQVPPQKTLVPVSTTIQSGLQKSSAVNSITTTAPTLSKTLSTTIPVQRVQAQPRKPTQQQLQLQTQLQLQKQQTSTSSHQPSQVTTFTNVVNQIVAGTFGYGIKRPADTEPAASMSSLLPKKKQQRKQSSDLTEGNWVPLDEYYYGKMEGDPSYWEEKGEYRFKCWYCSKMLYNNVRTMMHMQAHIDSEKQQNLDLSDLTQCKHCYKQFDTPFEMQTHIEKVHMSNANVLLCRICEKDHDSRNALANHMRQHHTACEMPYICQTCNFRSSMYSDAVDHFKKKHDSSQFLLCLYCLKVFRVKFVANGWGQTQMYYHHLLKHQSKTNSRKCPMCKLTFFNAIEVKAHRRKDHQSNQKGVIGHNAKFDAPDQVMIKVPEPGPSGNSSKQQAQQQLGVKSLNAPAVSKVQDYYGMKYPLAMQTLKCIECKTAMSTARHFRKYVECSLCRFATSCSTAYATHMMGFHSGGVTNLNVKIPVEKLMEKPMYCLCGFSSRLGNRIANHLVYCIKRTCYKEKPEVRGVAVDEREEESKSDDDPKRRPGASILDVLGLVKKQTLLPGTTGIATAPQETDVAADESVKTDDDDKEADSSGKETDKTSASSPTLEGGRTLRRFGSKTRSERASSRGSSGHESEFLEMSPRSSRLRSRRSLRRASSLEDGEETEVLDLADRDKNISKNSNSDKPEEDVKNSTGTKDKRCGHAAVDEDGAKVGIAGSESIEKAFEDKDDDDDAMMVEENDKSECGNQEDMIISSECKPFEDIEQDAERILKDSYRKNLEAGRMSLTNDQPDADDETSFKRMEEEDEDDIAQTVKQPAHEGKVGTECTKEVEELEADFEKSSADEPNKLQKNEDINGEAVPKDTDDSEHQAENISNDNSVQDSRKEVITCQEKPETGSSYCVEKGKDGSFVSEEDNIICKHQAETQEKPETESGNFEKSNEEESFEDDGECQTKIAAALENHEVISKESSDKKYEDVAFVKIEKSDHQTAEIIGQKKSDLEDSKCVSEISQEEERSNYKDSGDSEESVAKDTGKDEQDEKLINKDGFLGEYVKTEPEFEDVSADESEDMAEDRDESGEINMDNLGHCVESDQTEENEEKIDSLLVDDSQDLNRENEDELMELSKECEDALLKSDDESKNKENSDSFAAKEIKHNYYEKKPDLEDVENYKVQLAPTTGGSTTAVSAAESINEFNENLKPGIPDNKVTVIKLAGSLSGSETEDEKEKEQPLTSQGENQKELSGDTIVEEVRVEETLVKREEVKTERSEREQEGKTEALGNVQKTQQADRCFKKLDPKERSAHQICSHSVSEKEWTKVKSEHEEKSKSFKRAFDTTVSEEEKSADDKAKETKVNDGIYQSAMEQVEEIPTKSPAIKTLQESGSYQETSEKPSQKEIASTSLSEKQSKSQSSYEHKRHRSREHSTGKDSPHKEKSYERGSYDRTSHHGHSDRSSGRYPRDDYERQRYGGYDRHPHNHRSYGQDHRQYGGGDWHYQGSPRGGYKNYDNRHQNKDWGYNQDRVNRGSFRGSYRSGYRGGYY